MMYSSVEVLRNNLEQDEVAAVPQVSSYWTQLQAEEPPGAADGTNGATARASVLNLVEIHTEKVPF